MRRCGECSRGSSPTNSHAIDPGALEGLEKSGWGIPLTAQTQPKKFATPFLIALSPTHTGLGVATWALIARSITPLREDDLTNKVGAVNDKALTRIDDAIRMLYEL